MPIEDQPSVRLLQLNALADAPPMTMLEGHAVDGEESGQFASKASSQDPENATDDFAIQPLDFVPKTVNSLCPK